MTHTKVVVKPFGGKCMYTLGYTDDTVLLDTNIQVVSNLVNVIASGSKEDVDMTINASKTEDVNKASFRL